MHSPVSGASSKHWRRKYANLPMELEIEEAAEEEKEEEKAEDSAEEAMA